MPVITCPCGAQKSCTPTEVARGRKYCSAECAKTYRVYAVKPDPLDARVTVRLTQGERAALDHHADLEGVLITDLARRYILSGLS